ncbi:MAG: hypothetical protein ACK6AD_13360 [Cyanobacteriota bacterium]|jgi:hypothetical protein
MKTPLNVLASLPLAATIALGGFTGEARAQTAINVPLDANASFDQCAGKATTAKKFQVVICNQTGTPLVFSGAHNLLGDFPIGGEVPPYTARYVDWAPGGAGFFSNTANFQWAGTGKYVQFGIGWPPVGRRRIQICNVNSSGGSPAEKCWDDMGNSDDKDIRFYGGAPASRGFARMDNRNGAVQWIFQVK